MSFPLHLVSVSQTACVTSFGDNIGSPYQKPIVSERPSKWLLSVPEHEHPGEAIH